MRHKDGFRTRGVATGARIPLNVVTGRGSWHEHPHPQISSCNGISSDDAVVETHVGFSHIAMVDLAFARPDATAASLADAKVKQLADQVAEIRSMQTMVSAFRGLSL